MSEEELFEAMRPGSRSPLETRSKHDLGRFGLGLKTASFSQCRRLTVVTRRSERTSCAVWDLDQVKAADDWIIEVPTDYSAIPWTKQLGEAGTLVIWEKLDRLTVGASERGSRDFVNRLDEMARHLELVFHRYLDSSAGKSKISCALNDRKLEPHDPFHSNHLATIRGPVEEFRVGEQKIEYQAFTLPHHKKVSAIDWEKHAGIEGYIKNQGFYVYRERRLIIFGTWFNLARQTELTKLARVRVDIPNGMDAEWKIDIKKASAQPPAPVRNRLRRLVEDIGSRSKRVYTQRGAKLRDSEYVPVWVRRQDKNRIEYEINSQHPVIEGLVHKLPPDVEGQFRALLRMISGSLPLESLYADIGSSPLDVEGSQMDEPTFREAVEVTYRLLREGGYDHDEVCLMMRASEPWQSNWNQAQKQVEEMRELVIN